MNMKMITINTSNNGVFAAIASVIDQPDLENLILEMRQKLSLDIDLIPYSEFSSKYKTLVYKFDAKELAQYDELNEQSEWLENKRDSFSQREFDELHKQIMNWQQPRYLFEVKVRQSLEGYISGSNLVNALIKAIVCGEVSENDYKGIPNRGRVEHVQTNRKLYWLNKRRKENRKSYRDIASEKIDCIDNPKTVESAVRAYKDLLDQVRINK